MTCDYIGGLTREQFLLFEIRIVAKFICEGFQREEILKRLTEENLFQFPTERMISSIATTCFKRIEALESETLVYQLANSPVEVAKQINLYAMMKYNKIVWDFMTTVIGEKFRTQEFDFSKKDLKQVLTKSLVECGYLDNTRSTQLNNISIEPELEDEIRASGDLAALSAFNCFR